MQAGSLSFLLQEEDDVVKARVVAQADSQPDEDEGGDDQEGMARAEEHGEGKHRHQLGPEQINPVEMPPFVAAEDKETQEQGEPETAHEKPDGEGGPAE